MSRTNIDLDDKLVKQGLTMTHYKTKKELVNHALEEFVRKIRRKGILRLMGSNCWEGNLSEMRRSRI
jgi:Arc/MetJ family transcription regulator